MGKFDLQRYVEGLAWKAFLRNSDPALGIDDFLQEVHIALWRAETGFDSSKNAKFETYAVTCAKHALFDLFSMRIKQVPVEEDVLAYFDDDDFFQRLEQFCSKAVLTPRARVLVKGLLEYLEKLDKCSGEALRKVLNMTSHEFQLAVFELQIKFKTL